MMNTFAKISIGSALLMVAATGVAGSSTQAQAAEYSFKGSGTLKSVIEEVIKVNELTGVVTYKGEGSSTGEKAILAKTQALAPMSRAMKPAAKQKAGEVGLTVTENVIALDAVSLFVKADNALSEAGVVTLRKIYACEITNWSEIGGPDAKIIALGRDDLSGTTETFKKLVGIKKFGACVAIASSAEDIAKMTSEEPTAIGYAGRSSQTAGNRALAVSAEGKDIAYLPTEYNVQTFAYPLSRKLYVYDAKGEGLEPNDFEKALLATIKDRAAMDPIVEKFDFFTVD